MKKKLLFIVLFITIHAFSQSKMSDSISINNSFIRLMPPMMKMTAAFMDIQNNSSQKVILLKVSSSLATNTELHTHIKNNNGTALMQKMQNITIEANSTNELIHGGDHVMIMGLNQKLKAGDMHTLIFHFSDGSSKEKQIMVKRL